MNCSKQMDLCISSLNSWRRVLLQSVAIMMLAAVIGMAFNAVRKDRLQWVGSWSAEQMESALGSELFISLEEARVLFLVQGAVFVDARPGDLFQLGHIKGARNLPWGEFNDLFPQVAKEISLDSLIIVYCDGTTCNLSDEVANALLENGYPNVRVLKDGWTLWQQANLPIENSSG